MDNKFTFHGRVSFEVSFFGVCHFFSMNTIKHSQTATFTTSDIVFDYDQVNVLSKIIIQHTTSMIFTANFRITIM